MLFVQVGQLVPAVSWDTPRFVQNNKEHCVDVNKNSGGHWREAGTRGRKVWAAVDWAGGPSASCPPQLALLSGGCFSA